MGSETRPYQPPPPLVPLVNLGHVVRGIETDPNSNGILVGLREINFYFLEGIRVRCTVTATLGSQMGEVWSSEAVVTISDDLDRHHKFVQWGPHQVLFKNAGTGEETWQHTRNSRIHRTAIGTRREMLRQCAEDAGYPPATRDLGRSRGALRYTDTLPYAWDDLNAHRHHYLCDYCFFGGPNKTKPLAQEDWF